MILQKTSGLTFVKPALELHRELLVVHRTAT
jgi:hypothetical protein